MTPSSHMLTCWRNCLSCQSSKDCPIKTSPSIMIIKSMRSMLKRPNKENRFIIVSTMIGITLPSPLRARTPTTYSFVWKAKIPWVWNKSLRNATKRNSMPSVKMTSLWCQLSSLISITALMNSNCLSLMQGLKATSFKRFSKTLSWKLTNQEPRSKTKPLSWWTDACQCLRNRKSSFWTSHSGS